MTLVDRGCDPKGWALPGGPIPWGDSIESSLKRHVRQQTGYEINVEATLGAFSAWSDDPNQRITIVYLVKVVDQIADCQPTEQVRRARQFSPRGCPEAMVLDHRAILEVALKHVT